MKFQRGITIIELVITLSVMAVVFTAVNAVAVRWTQSSMSDGQASQTDSLIRGMSVFYAENGAWPDQANNCVGARNVLTAGADPYLAGVAANNQFNFPIIIACTPRTASITQSVPPNLAADLARKLGNTRVINAGAGTIRTDLVSSRVAEKLNDAFQTDGSSELENDADFGGNDLLNLNQVTLAGNLETQNAQVNNLVANTSVKAQRYIDADDNNFLFDLNGNSNLNIVSTATLGLTRYASAGTPCSTGDIALTSDQDLLSCGASNEFESDAQKARFRSIDPIILLDTTSSWGIVDVIIPVGANLVDPESKLIQLTAFCQISRGDRRNPSIISAESWDDRTRRNLLKAVAGGDRDNVYSSNSMLQAIGPTRRIQFRHGGEDCNYAQILVDGYVL